MRKPIAIAIAAVLVLLAAGTGMLYSRYRQTQASYARMQASDQNVREQYAQTIDAIAQIQDSLNSISVGEGQLSSESSSLSQERSMSGPNSQQALDRIALLRASIQRSKDRIASLEAEVHRRGIKVDGLQKMIAGLRRTVSEREQQVAELSTQVEGLKTQVNGLQTQVAEVQDTVRVRDEAIATRQHELATVYYAAGSKSDLRRSGIITAKGGLLGIGRTLTPAAVGTTDAFKPIDTDQESVLRLAGKRAQVLTAQPASSYELRPTPEGMELHILQPQEFRKVRQLVIVTA